MTRKISRLGLILAMGAALGGSAPLPGASLDRSPEKRRRAAPAPPPPVERNKTQRELAAEAKRARRGERNLRLAAKAAPAPVPLPSAADCAAAEDGAPLPGALTSNQRTLLTHLQGGYDRPVDALLPYFSSPQAARATIAAARKAGLVEVLGLLVRITPYGLVSLAAAR